MINNTNNLVDIAMKEISDYESKSVPLNDYTSDYSQYKTIQKNKAQQNQSFLTQVAEGQTDDRVYGDIINPMVQTGVVNADIDAKDLTAFVENDRNKKDKYIVQSLITHFCNQTNQGNTINEMIETIFDDGNVILRAIPEKDSNNGKIFDFVNSGNIYITDTTAKNIEDTTVIEKQLFNQSQLRQYSKEWANIEEVIKSYSGGNESEIPYYEIYYRYGEMSKTQLNKVKEQLFDVEAKEEETDEYVKSLFIFVKAKSGDKDKHWGKEGKGIPVFIEELKPEKVKVSEQLTFEYYYPYLAGHLGSYKGRFWREGYREIGRPYQNRANELNNQLREVMKLASKIIFWSSDNDIAGKNILSSLKNGQVIKTSHLAVLNNIFPNLSLYAEEWNKNIQECQKALRAFEVASGEALPSSTTATAVAIQNQAVGRYYGFYQEKIGLLLSQVWKRWVIPKLLKKTTANEKIEIIGNPEFMNEYIDLLVENRFLDRIKDIALLGGIETKQGYEFFKEQTKKSILENKQLFEKIDDEFLKDLEVYVGLNPTGEIFNKQNKISNAMKMAEMLMPTDPQQAQSLLVEVGQELGMNIKQPAPQPQMQEQGQPNIPQMPQKEKSAQEQELSNAKL